MKNEKKILKIIFHILLHEIFFNKNIKNAILLKNNKIINRKILIFLYKYKLFLYAIDFFIIIISYNYLKFLLSYDKDFLNILSK